MFDDFDLQVSYEEFSDEEVFGILLDLNYEEWDA